ncbi:uncharacterized protein LOC119190275 [Manduca sexta]|uniref:uncharacterized protein LOC119190275 n=1 Tax=Manduca sexta TaxID=7130 RepID=UPI001890B18B|nr:uncharacterized protein LOC119190275 [Manduca sexta]
MATREDQIKDLKEKNNELVQKVQYWKMTAAQREDEKLALMKEVNELRLKLSRLRSTGGVQARQFDSAIQATSERALAHLVQASGEIAHTIELAKTYMRDRQELDAASPRWSAIGGTPTEKTDKIHRVPPMMIGGQSIQPVVALSRTLFNTSNTQPASRSPNRSLTGRAVPMHMLQDVYIPLTRIDAGNRPADNAEAETDAQDADNSTEEVGLDDSVERMDDSQEASESEDFDASRRLDAVTEDIEPEDEVQTPQTRNKVDNPLEGPSWLLDTPSKPRTGNLEPDSTTEVDEATCVSPPNSDQTEDDAARLAWRRRCSRRRCGAASARARPARTPPRSPRAARARTHSPFTPVTLAQRRNSNNGRVLKVLVAKMRLSSGSEDALTSPPPALARLDAPSPNGATDAALLVSDANNDDTMSPMEVCAREPIAQSSRRDSRHDRTERHTKDAKRSDHAAPEPHDKSDHHDRSDRHDKSEHDRTDRHDRSEVNRSDRFVSMERGSRAGSEASVLSSDGRDSDSDPAREGRTRRTRKPITYKEKPLNRKLRR